MQFKHLLLIVIICGIIYYLYKLNNKTSQIQPIKSTQSEPIQPLQQIEPIQQIEPVQQIIIPSPYIDPYISPYYDPYYYPYWDPYDLYPYGIIGVDAGADWNSTYNVVGHGYHKRRDRKNRRDIRRDSRDIRRNIRRDRRDRRDRRR